MRLLCAKLIQCRCRFSWGPAAVSNAMWTGVWVKDILKHVGIKSFEEGGKHVCFVGADKLPNGYYGTSIRREVGQGERDAVVGVFLLFWFCCQLANVLGCMYVHQGLARQV